MASQVMQSQMPIAEFLPTDDSFNWMRTLVEIGAWVATVDPSRPLTVAVCLGHASPAIHRAYAKSVRVELPPLEEYERDKAKVMMLPKAA
jgi:hypothetical protein